MNGVEVHFLLEKEDFNAQYEISDELRVSVFDGKGFLQEKECCSFHEILIADYVKSEFYYSPYFVYRGGRISLTSQNKYETDCYLFTKKKAYADKLNANQKYKRLRIHNGLLNCLYDNPSFLVNYTKDSCNFKMPINGPRPLTKEITVENDNIERVFFGGETSWSSDFTKWQCAVDIKYSNYIEISFQRPIKLNEVKRYLDKINFFINAYCFKKKNASHVTLFTELGEEYDLFCQSIKANQECDGLLYFPIKMDFFDYFEKVLKEIDYETLKEENKLSPLQNKELSSLEDSFLYYYKYIDRFMGTIISKQEGKKTTQKQHIGKFVEVYKYLFKKDMQLDEDLGIKAVSLRNHYAHEGYFFTKGEFPVKDNGKVKYRMAIDYDWLRDLVFTLKVGSITMLLKEYLHLEIDENAAYDACLKQLD